ncbi:hypothetical protein BOSE21B_110496 [Bosea sp. 21B]|nr:hypothetical protein BOSE21B_110496 [Bosea sp. 21B]CAD5279693.1 hypothetical protein BOSE7B_40721 [Bosea sp. 7B]VXC83457.1 hypothetical protein BOSE127_60119 [Bosea sp. 127]
MLRFAPHAPGVSSFVSPFRLYTSVESNAKISFFRKYDMPYKPHPDPKGGSHVQFPREPPRGRRRSRERRRHT